MKSEKMEESKAMLNQESEEAQAQQAQESPEERNESLDSSENSENSEKSEGAEGAEAGTGSEGTEGTESGADPEGADGAEGSGEAGSEPGPEFGSLASVMSLCVSMMSGKVDEAELKLLMDAIAARERIGELERRIEKEAEEHAAELEEKTAEAYRAGELAGRNAQISEVLGSAPQMMPNLGGIPAPSSRRPGTIFDLAADAR